MKIAYNPTSAEALTKAPANNDITFDLRGLNIFARGVKFKGTDTTYSVFKKHTSEGKGGYNGLVPVPSYTTTNIRYLREDGTWQAFRSLTILTNGTSLGSYNGSTDQTFNITYSNVGAAPAVHNHTSNQITALTGYTGYTESTSNLALTTSDSLNTALGKLEYKGDLGVSAYNIVSAANDGDGTIENLNEILKVLQGISDTDTIKNLLGKYLPLAGGVMSGLIMRPGVSASWVKGRDGALIRNTTYTGYNPILSMKTTNGSWELGVYQNDALHLTYITDSNYNSGNNVRTWGIDFPKKSGVVALTSDIPTTASLDGRYVNISGDTMNGKLIINTSGGGNQFLINNTAGGETYFYLASAGTNKGALTVALSSYGTAIYNAVNAKYLGITDSGVPHFLGNELLHKGNYTIILDSRYYTEAESDAKYVTLATSQTITGIKTFTKLLKFTIASGTAPFIVNSNTVVTNLNADLLDGYHVGNTINSITFWANLGGCTEENNGDTSDTSNYKNFLRRITGSSPYASMLQGTCFLGTLIPNSERFIIGKSYDKTAYNDGMPRYSYFLSLNLNGRLLTYGTLDGSYYEHTLAFLSDNVASATKLQTPRAINGTNFDGTAPITTTYWGTARNISIADYDNSHVGTAVSVNGSTNYTLKLPDTIKARLIGSANAIHYLDNRSDNLNPYDAWAYKGILYSLKFNTADGLSDGGDYHGSMTLHQWNDASGGLVHQLAFTSNGNMWDRHGSSSWSAWRRFAFAGESYTKEESDDKYYIKADGSFILTTAPMIKGTYAKIPLFTGNAGWYRVATINNGTYGYGSWILYICGAYTDLVNTNAILHIDTMYSAAIITQVSGCVGSITKIRLVNVRGNQFYVDVYITSSDNVGSSHFYFLGNGTVTPNFTPVEITESVTPKAEITLRQGGFAHNSELADAATKLKTTCTIWGLSFYGTNNVSGNMTGVGNINFSTNLELNISDRIYKFGTTNQSAAADVNVGSLLVSSVWSDRSKVPTNGIYCKGNVGIGITPSLKLHVNGNVLANGYMKSGSSDSYVLLGGGGHKALSDFVLKSDELNTNVTIITKNLNVTLAWMDTGIEGTNLPANGTYIVLVYVKANDSTGNMWYCYSSGIMSWYNAVTNDTKADEIILHRSGHAYTKIIYLRTIMLASNKPLKLLISANTDIGAAYDYVFKFKKII